MDRVRNRVWKESRLGVLGQAGLSQLRETQPKGCSPHLLTSLRFGGTLEGAFLEQPFTQALNIFQSSEVEFGTSQPTQGKPEPPPV